MSARDLPAHEHEFEAAHGLPEPLPPGEHILWQGAPDFRSLARNAFHVRAIGAYFGVMLGLRAAYAGGQTGSVVDGLVAAAWLVPLVLAAMSMLYLMAWLTSRTSVYTITDQRVVMRVGIVLSLTFNLPLARIRAADARLKPGQPGDIALALEGNGTHIAYVHLWPHARPWRVTRTEPMLRSVPEAERVSQMLAGTWRAARDVAPQTFAMPTPVRQPAAVNDAGCTLDTQLAA